MSSSLTPDLLIQSMHRYGKPREQWRVGGEFERALVRGDGHAVAYFDADGVKWFLETFQAATGWKAKFEGENPIELKHGGTYLTLEPGGQVELSGAPYTHLTDLAAEVRENQALIRQLVAGHDLHWISCGLTPFAKIADIPFVPKGRYVVMRAYLPQHGALSHWMMKGTCSVQASFDFADEADCARKFHLALDLAPLTVAMFANSPLAEGQLTEYQSFRAHIWTQTDAARTGFPPDVRAGYTHAGWVNYLLDRPMMFYMRDGQWTPANGVTFRAWMEQGIDGVFPEEADWELHQTSVFPEVRVKRVIEIRSADAVSAELGIAFCAYWKGLLYSDDALFAARAVADAFLKGGTHEARHLEAARSGLEGTYGDRTGAAWAAELVEIAARGLADLGEDTSLIEPLRALVATGRSPAAAIRDAWATDPSPAAILPLVAY